MEKEIIFFGKKTKVACDEKCGKAWGINTRPRFFPELGEGYVFEYGEDSCSPEQDELPELKNEDDYAYLPDSKLGVAPVDPGTYEGGHAKPTCDDEKGNKWCVRECERCVMSGIGEIHKPLILPDFSKPLYNIPREQN